MPVKISIDEIEIENIRGSLVSVICIIQMNILDSQASVFSNVESIFSHKG